jgi:hypothetical protein
LVSLLKPRGTVPPYVTEYSFLEPEASRLLVA